MSTENHSRTSPFIHPTAIIEIGATLAPDVSVGPYAYVGAGVVLGPGCVVHHHATVEGNVVMGRDNHVWPYALIGGKTHDLKFKGGNPGLRVGDNNDFREYVTVHPATDDGKFTIIGNHNHLLAYSHVAHDCALGDHIVMSGQNALAGHVTVGDHAVIAWGAGVHQYCRVGCYAMVGGMSRNTKDIPPYMITEGVPAVVRAVNKVNLERNGFTPEQITRIGRAHRIFYRDGLNRTQALEKLKTTPDLMESPEVRNIVAFYETSERGVA
ncbi:MAG: acyl-ACP--UDP-N-acetylglucosamine O-acyltransferase [Puniceicoccales bacterium]|jgi:UDP-N-acetylglucosamine acyltransferase|nr:acyl-ACP--UDP-N-acetylglucosamine O-acyltransferase [Puniceicoccales bacterium]